MTLTILLNKSYSSVSPQRRSPAGARVDMSRLAEQDGLSQSLPERGSFTEGDTIFAVSLDDNLGPTIVLTPLALVYLFAQ